MTLLFPLEIEYSRELAVPGIVRLCMKNIVIIIVRIVRAVQLVQIPAFPSLMLLYFVYYIVLFCRNRVRFTAEYTS